MRELKFRLWSKIAQCIIPWEEVQLKPHTIFDKSKWVAMQFTGLKDKNDVDVYEGDIVKAHIQNMDFEAIIKWGKGSWSLKCDRRNREKWGTIKYYKLPHSDNIEVVGNIYENTVTCADESLGQ